MGDIGGGGGGAVNKSHYSSFGIYFTFFHLKLVWLTANELYHDMQVKQHVGEQGTRAITLTSFFVIAHFTNLIYPVNLMNRRFLQFIEYAYLHMA